MLRGSDVENGSSEDRGDQSGREGLLVVAALGGPRVPLGVDVRFLQDPVRRHQVGGPKLDRVPDLRPTHEKPASERGPGSSASASMTLWATAPSEPA
jgi:hypothetical protein